MILHKSSLCLPFLSKVGQCALNHLYSFQLSLGWILLLGTLGPYLCCVMSTGLNGGETCQHYAWNIADSKRVLDWLMFLQAMLRRLITSQELQLYVKTHDFPDLFSLNLKTNFFLSFSRIRKSSLRRKRIVSCYFFKMQMIFLSIFLPARVFLVKTVDEANGP